MYRVWIPCRRVAMLALVAVVWLVAPAGVHASVRVAVGVPVVITPVPVVYRVPGAVWWDPVRHGHHRHYRHHRHHRQHRHGWHHQRGWRRW